jgi:O-antigen/teichoic acid export membrane protein
MSTPQALQLAPNPANTPTASRSINRRLFVSSGRVSLNQGIGLLLAFGIQAFISRTCGADALGAVTLFLSWLGILSVITVPGLEGTLVYFLPRFEHDLASRRHVIQRFLGLTGAVSFAVATVVAVSGGRLLALIGLPATARAALCLCILVFSTGKLLDAVLLGLKDAPALGYFNNVRTVARFVFCLPVLLFPGARWSILFYAIVLECTLSLLLRYISIRRRYPGLLILKPAAAPTLARQNKIGGAIILPMLGISAIDTVYPLLDKAVLGMMVPLTLVGIYRIADAVAALNSMFVSPFIAFWPYISQLHEQKRLDELRESYRSVTLLIIALMVPFTLALVELSPSILSLFGRLFASQGRTIFMVLAFGTAIDAIAGPAGAVLKLTGHARLSFCINTGLLVLYLWLTVALAKNYGILGAAIAKMVVTVVGNVSNVIANRILLHVFPYTWKHAGMLLAGIAILCSRWALFPSAAGLGGQALAGFIQAATFISVTLVLLRREIVPQLQLWTQKGFALDARD